MPDITNQDAEHHDRKEETMVVGVQRHDDGSHTWQLRVCGIVHGEGSASHGPDALAQAAFILRDRAEEAARTHVSKPLADERKTDG